MTQVSVLFHPVSLGYENTVLTCTPLSQDSIRAAAKDVAYDLMSYYHGNESGMTPGILPGPPPNGNYYWWQGGALWGTMIDYWHFTGDDTYNQVVYEAILAQAAPGRDFMDKNWTLSLGNDDQSFWGMSALLAAENKFMDPPEDEPQWLALAQAVWNEQAAPDRQDNECGGGLRWQIYPTNNGYDYKNTIANGAFFNMGARLARYTNNQTYADWAIKTWDWLTSVGYIDSEYNVFDGGHIPHNCTDINRQQFSYNAAVLLLGAAHMYNYTDGSAEWQTRVEDLVGAIERVFFVDGIAWEPTCEDSGHCTEDMLSFKGYVHRWMAVATQVAPFVKDKITSFLSTSTAAAVKQCTGGDNGRQCGFHWKSGVYDGVTGAGQQMNVLGALCSMLLDDAQVPVTNSTGGTSGGNPNAGGSSSTNTVSPITTGDRAGAGILTLVVMSSAIGCLTWMVWK
ncbi:glycoside hydrolase family 76 protein [Xylariomycetidae sp. FL2044]|nr:glycoside hydrolase family 76 protein [Xylariomycetidae sp. FL2044]